MHDNDIKGFKVDTSEIKLLAYADDIALFCEDKRGNEGNELEVTAMFCSVTLSAVNWSESLGYGTEAAILQYISKM